MALIPSLIWGLALLLLLGSDSSQSMATTAQQLQGVQHFSGNLDEPFPVNHSCTVGSYAFDAENATLGLYCNTDDVSAFAYDWTFIDLNLCIGNNDGALVPSPEGNYSNSCDHCDVTWSHVDLTPVTTTFTTTPHTWITNTVTSVSTPRWDDLYLGCGGCSNRDYQRNPATIDLNDFMINENGTIGCHNFRGSTMHIKPVPMITAAVATRIEAAVPATTGVATAP